MSVNTPNHELLLSFPNDSGIIQAGSETSGYQPFGVAKSYSEFIHMVEFRFKTGVRLSFAYHWLTRSELDPSLGMTIIFSDIAVTIRGRHLGQLATLLAEHQVRWICEADQPTAELISETATLIESIQTQPLRTPTVARGT